MDSCLFIHGFTGGEYEIAPLAQFMEQHNYRSRTLTLKGHGGSRRDLLQSDRLNAAQGNPGISTVSPRELCRLSADYSTYPHRAGRPGSSG